MIKNEVINIPIRNRKGIDKRQEETMRLNANIDSYILDNINKPKAEVLKGALKKFEASTKRINENYEKIINMLRDEEEENIKDKLHSEKVLRMGFRTGVQFPSAPPTMHT